MSVGRGWNPRARVGQPGSRTRTGSGPDAPARRASGPDQRRLAPTPSRPQCHDGRIKVVVGARPSSMSRGRHDAPDSGATGSLRGRPPPRVGHAGPRRAARRPPWRLLEAEAGDRIEEQCGPQTHRRRGIRSDDQAQGDGRKEDGTERGRQDLPRHPVPPSTATMETGVAGSGLMPEDHGAMVPLLHPLGRGDSPAHGYRRIAAVDLVVQTDTGRRRHARAERPTLTSWQKLSAWWGVQA